MTTKSIVLNPNVVRARSRLLCRFPFYGTARELSNTERRFAKMRAKRIMDAMPPPLKKETMPSNKELKIREDHFEEQARRFLENGWEKKFSHSIDRDDFGDAWPHLIVDSLTAIIENLTKGANKARILQVGCSWGPLLEFLRVNLGAEVYGLETDDKAIGLAHRLGRTYIHKGAVQILPFAETSFDLVLSRNLLCSEYFLPYGPVINSFKEREAFREEFRENHSIECDFNDPHKIRIFSEISRVLKSGGYFVSYLEDYVQPRYLSRDFSRFFLVEGWRNELKIVQK